MFIEGHMIGGYTAQLSEKTPFSKGSTACHHCTKRFKRPVFPAKVSFLKRTCISEVGLNSPTDVSNELNLTQTSLSIFNLDEHYLFCWMDTNLTLADKMSGINIQLQQQKC